MLVLGVFGQPSRVSVGGSAIAECQVCGILRGFASLQEGRPADHALNVAGLAVLSSG